MLPGDLKGQTAVVYADLTTSLSLCAQIDPRTKTTNTT